jgi:hypothetical protein
MAKRKRSPDDLLASEQFPELNEAFYATRPWTYFRQRERVVALTAGAGEKLVAIGREGVTVGRLNYTLEADESRDARDAEDREQFVLAESEVLLHHAAETLLRLYLAHEGTPSCPWLSIARVRNPRQFKTMVEDRFLGDLSREERHRKLTEVFFGTSDRSGIDPCPPADLWEQGADNIESFLTHYARHFLDADIYNALKHGLAVRPGHASTQLDDGALLKADGPAIEYLSIRDNTSGRPRWNLSTHWIEVDRSLSLTYLATKLMESLWTMARYRYLGDKPDSLDAWVKPAYADVVGRLEEGQEAAVFIETKHIELTYYVEQRGEGGADGVSNATTDP